MVKNCALTQKTLQMTGTKVDVVIGIDVSHSCGSECWFYSRWTISLPSFSVGV